MASIIKVNGKWRAQIRRKGMKTITETFEEGAAGKRNAEAWAAKLENELNEGRKVGIHGLVGKTLRDAAHQYENEVDRSTSHMYLVKKLKNCNLADTPLHLLTDEDVVQYIKAQTGGNVAKGCELSTLNAILKRAKYGWDWHVPTAVMEEPYKRLRVLNMIGKSDGRERRPTAKELDTLCLHKFRGSRNGVGRPYPMEDIIMFAVHTAMRRAEITRIRWSDLNLEDKTIVIRDRKHPTKKKGNHKTVPLLSEAIDIIMRQPRVEGEDRIFPFDANSITKYFTEACEKNKIENLKFHDLRHEGTSRLFELGYDIMVVRLFTGHEDLKMLKRYTHLSPKNLHRPTAKGQTGGVPEMSPELLQALLRQIAQDPAALAGLLAAAMKPQAV